MYEKCNPSHPDKVADRIAGAIVDLAYLKNTKYISLAPALKDKTNNPKIAVEVLVGHGECTIITESSVVFELNEIKEIVNRIAGKQKLNLIQVPQDTHLAENQAKGLKCGDNGIFKGVPVSDEEKQLTEIARANYNAFKSDGKYIIDGNKVILCQSNATNYEIARVTGWHVDKTKLIINPLGEWTGGTNVDTGATNRKLGSDMGRGVTGGGLHGKDLSKADVSINIYLHILAQNTGIPCEASCAIGDEEVTITRVMKGKHRETLLYKEIVELAREYIVAVGGFEKFAEWGLVR